jgi:imidazolonepropionase-like amidohydrolase
VKVFGSTGGGDDVTGEQTVSFEEMKAIINTAHSAGHKVAIHSYGPNGARDAIRAGTDTLEHATDLDDATIAESAGVHHLCKSEPGKKCNTAQPLQARRFISPARCLIRRSGSISPTFSIAAVPRRCRIC